jgi:hypothetical protein
MKFHEHPFSENRAVPCGRTDGRTDRQTDMMQLTAALRNFANVAKNGARGPKHVAYL